MNTMVLGTPAQCREELEHIAKTFDVDELMIVNVTHSFKPRISSYQMLAEQIRTSERHRSIDHEQQPRNRQHHPNRCL